MGAPEKKQEDPLLTTTVISDPNLDHQFDEKPEKQNKSWKRFRSQGWRFGAIVCSAVTALVLAINILLLLGAEIKNGFPGFNSDSGKHPLYTGNCNTAKRLNTGVHFLINVLSTILLSASNYCMQCMSAPTRKEINEAHGKRKWLDIGVLSFRNLKNVSRKRAVLYWLLAISSLPLHLFYNSAVFSSIGGNEAYLYSVNEAFADPNAESYLGWGFPTNLRNFDTYKYIGPGTETVANQLFDQARKGSLQRLEPLECLDAYAQTFQTNRGSLLMVVPVGTERFDKDYQRAKEPNNLYFTNEPMLKYENFVKLASPTSGEHNEWAFNWVCYEDGMDGNIPCAYRLEPKRANITAWKPFKRDILYCLSEPLPEQCRLVYSTYLMLIVIFMNAFKVGVMFYLAYGIKETPILTVGDAISSFMQEPEERTEGMCLISKREITKTTSKELGWSANPAAKQYNPKIHHKFAAASKTRWITTILLLSISVLGCIVLLTWGIYEIPGSKKDLKTLFSLGLGAIDTSTFIRWNIPYSGAAGVLGNVVTANAPQVVLSFIYLTYNGLFTSMSLANEWSEKALSHKGLRVSAKPMGEQRASYVLQLPKRWSIPLMVVSGILHWLVSQSLFLVAVDAFALKNTRVRRHVESGDYMTCGYSPVAIVCVVVIGFFMLVALLIVGFGRLKSAMPVVGSCSAAIAAACHFGGQGAEDMAFRRVRWGAVVQPGSEGEVGHCCFSAGEVTEPRVGQLYAGLGERVRVREKFE